MQPLPECHMSIIQIIHKRIMIVITLNQGMLLPGLRIRKIISQFPKTCLSFPKDKRMIILYDGAYLSLAYAGQQKPVFLY